MQVEGWFAGKVGIRKDINFCSREVKCLYMAVGERFAGVGFVRFKVRWTMVKRKVRKLSLGLQKYWPSEVYRWWCTLQMSRFTIKKQTYTTANAVYHAYPASETPSISF